MQFAVTEGELADHAVPVEGLVQAPAKHLYQARPCDRSCTSPSSQVIDEAWPTCRLSPHVRHSSSSLSSKSVAKNSRLVSVKPPCRKRSDRLSSLGMVQRMMVTLTCCVAASAHRS